MAPLPSFASAADDGRKRSSNSMEKSKVSHLSRQLQLRLQYAKLKVEHGWHKQNLNEVENLYFRRSYAQPRRKPSYAPTTQTSYSSTSPTQPLSSQSSLSFKTHSISQINDSESESTEPLSANTAVADEISPSDEAIETLPTPQTAMSHSNTSPVRIIASHTTLTLPQTHHPTASAASTSSTAIPARPIQLSARALQKQPLHTVAPLLTSTTQPQQPAGMPAYPASVSTPSSVPVVPTYIHFPSPSTPRVSSLTYDSFWSSHTASAIAKRPLSFRSSASSSAAVLASVFSGGGGGKDEEYGSGKSYNIGNIRNDITAYPSSISAGIDRSPAAGYGHGVSGRTSSVPVGTSPMSISLSGDVSAYSAKPPNNVARVESVGAMP